MGFSLMKIQKLLKSSQPTMRNLQKACDGGCLVTHQQTRSFFQTFQVSKKALAVVFVKWECCCRSSGLRRLRFHSSLHSVAHPRTAAGAVVWAAIGAHAAT